MENKKGITVTNTFQNFKKVLDKFNCKTNQIWIDKGSEFYNRSVKSWLQDNNIKTYSVCNEGRFIVAERLIRTLKNKIFKYITSILKYLYIDKLDDIVDEYNIKYYRAIKMKPINVKSSTYIDFDIKNNDKDPKFRISDQVRILKYKNIFAKGYMPSWS